ncbi:MAG: DUF1838 family protein [Gammaproteobacteria bacterium]
MLDTPTLEASPQVAERLNLHDPASRARTFAKIKGSSADETVYTFCRLHLYLWLNDGNLQPMLTMQNLNVAQWRALPDGKHRGVIREVGVYTAFDTDAPIQQWVNPVTGEAREVWQFFGGPLQVDIGPNGMETGVGATLKPREMRTDVIGDRILLANQSAFSFPNPFNADQWPKAAGGPQFFWDSHYFFAANVADVINPKVTNAISTVQFQNLVSFHPWLGMGKTPGRTYGKGLGAKLRSLDDLPTAPRRLFEQFTPEIFDIANWKEPRVDFVEYMKNRKT